MKKSLLFLLFSLHALFPYELGVVTMFRNEAPYLKEWIEYHKLLGVEHFILYNDRSMDEWREVLEPYICSNLVEVIEWSHHSGVSVFPGWQTEAYKDGLHRSKGNTKWLLFIDVDEFVLPKKNGTILECLEEFFPTASGVYMCWRNFGTNGVYLKPGDSVLTHLTAASHPLHPRNAAGKCIVKVDEVEIDYVWSPHQLPVRKGGQYYNGSGKPLYFVEWGLQKDLQVDPQHTSDHIQINHYVMKDEAFFHNVRIPRAQSGEYGEVHVMLEHYKSFNEMQDRLILEFLEKYHPTYFIK